MDISIASQIASTAAAIAAVFVALYVHHDSKTAQVVAYLEHDRDHGAMLLMVKNFGSGIARDIEIDGFDCPTSDNKLGGYIAKSFIFRGIPMLVSGASRSTVIMSGKDLSEFSDSRNEITLKYCVRSFWGRQKTVEDRCVLDYYSFAGSTYTKSDIHEIAHRLESIAKDQGAMSSSLKTLAKRLQGDACE
jgi:hypothetical protein